ncbi:hypothetical protein QGN32_06520 [Mycolicibacterium sp. ND9-15]|uniref:DUF7161 family protein n=1 Tax=Mycolicibacterium sp. ND9-15 TaxID=3042320 RepID=UPI002DD930C9|nr:hypothetical protein [Mycolicibacterium sp. ND9-15]WSE57529.1 hypothetical protein QGN32_06520 [Mycolicibacterium sp. ND9-15]
MSKSQQVLAPIGYDQTGLRGQLAQVLVDEPTDEIDWPADLPPGTELVVVVDDTPNPHHTLRVHPVGDATRVALVVYDQLALVPSDRPRMRGASGPDGPPAGLERLKAFLKVR